MHLFIFKITLENTNTVKNGGHSDCNAAQESESCYKRGIHFLKKVLLRVILKAWAQSLNHERQVLTISTLYLYLFRKYGAPLKGQSTHRLPQRCRHPHPPTPCCFAQGSSRAKAGLLPMSPFAATLSAVSCLYRILYLFKAATTQF